MTVRQHLQNGINQVMLAIAAGKSEGNEELHPLHYEKLEEIHESLVSILRSVHAREQLGEKIGDMVHEDRGECTGCYQDPCVCLPDETEVEWHSS